MGGKTKEEIYSHQLRIFDVCGKMKVTWGLCAPEQTRSEEAKMPGQILRHLGSISILLQSQVGIFRPDASAVALRVMKELAGMVDTPILEFIQKRGLLQALHDPVVYLPKLRARRPKQRSALGWSLYAAMSGNSDTAKIPANLVWILAFMELSAMSTYVLDDIIDGQPKRERRCATHVRYGVNNAWIAGSQQAWLSLEMLERLELPAARKLQVLQLAVRMWSLMWEGEGLNEHMGRGTTVEFYLDRCRRVGSIMYDYVCQMAAIVAGAEAREIKLASGIGDAFGMAAMISNDLMCYLPEEHLKRYSVAQNRVPYEDIRKGIWTYPVVRAWGQANDSQRKLLLSVIGCEDASDSQCAKFVSLVRGLGGIEATLDLGSSYRRELMVGVSLLPAGPGRDILVAMGDNLEHVRKYFAAP